MNNSILIWGCKIHCQVLMYLIKTNQITYKNKKIQNLQTKFLVDPFLEQLPFSSELKLINLKREFNQVTKKSNYFITSIGGVYGYARNMISSRLSKLKLKPLSIVSDSANIAKSVILKQGVQIYQNAILDHYSSIGKYSVINIGAIIEHHCKIGKGVHIMPGAVLAGNIEVSDFATVGTGATILPNLKIGRGAIIGAGATVTKDVSNYEVVIGNPAKKLRKNKLVFYDKGFFDI